MLEGGRERGRKLELELGVRVEVGVGVGATHVTQWANRLSRACLGGCSFKVLTNGSCCRPLRPSPGCPAAFWRWNCVPTNMTLRRRTGTSVPSACPGGGGRLHPVLMRHLPGYLSKLGGGVKPGVGGGGPAGGRGGVWLGVRGASSQG